ncbi:MAG: hypothetical protein HY706_14340 [Candidatus Hydrogenedentes bacterium]|nr:hypothetical protein [Candidatus Hydrogenedentota bacterium]
MLPREEHYIPPSARLSVLPEKISEAVDRLENESYRKLTESEFEYFTGRRPPTGGDGYLVRAVRWSGNAGVHGTWIIFESDEFIYVQFGVLGRHYVPKVREPLVLILSTPPKDVFVMCEMAE